MYISRLIFCDWVTTPWNVIHSCVPLISLNWHLWFNPSKNCNRRHSIQYCGIFFHQQTGRFCCENVFIHVKSVLSIVAPSAFLSLMNFNVNLMLISKSVSPLITKPSGKQLDYTYYDTSMKQCYCSNKLYCTLVQLIDWQYVRASNQMESLTIVYQSTIYLH